MKPHIKSISRALLILTLGILLTHCNDNFLDQNKLGEETSGIYFISQEKAIASLTAAYSDLKDYRLGWSQWAFGETLSDNAIYSGSDADHTSFEPLKTFNAPASANLVRYRWQICYRGINKSSQTIEGVQKMKDELFESAAMKKRIIAEAKVLRAFYHFELARAFGKIPILDHLIKNPNEKIGQSKMNEVYSFIIKELEAAEPNLPLKSKYSGTDLGRVTKGFAQALLTKVNLYAKNYDKAKYWAQKVINSGEYKLDPDFAHIFSFDGENGIESIFEINFINSTTETSAFKNNGNFQTLFMLPRNITYGYGINQPTKNLANAFDDAGDEIRKKATLLTTDEVYEKEIPKEVWDWYNKQTDRKLANDSINKWKAKLIFNRTGYYQKKMYVAPVNRSAQIRNNANNIRVMRYAEVLLMYAEACAQTSDEANARMALNRVRSRAHLPEVTAFGPALINAIYAERRLELAGENDRYYDLVRTGRANILSYWTEAKKYWPVPQSEIDKTTGEISQNPGY